MARGYHDGAAPRIEDLGLDWETARESSLEELAQEGARLVLSAFVAREVEELLGAEPWERVEDRRGYRNGVRARKVRLGAGQVEVPFPKVRGTEAPFRSRVLRAWQRASAPLTAVMPALYAEGLSTRDFGRALKPLWKETGLSRSSVSRANAVLWEQFAAWRRRDLSKEEVLYVFLDGYYMGVRRGTTEKEAILVAHGFRKDGSRVLLGVYLGVRESKRSWKSVLVDLQHRGLAMPALVVTDGNAGVIAALGEGDWKDVPRQRCIVHRTRNVLDRIPKGHQMEVRKALTRIWYAPSEKEALERAAEFARKYGPVFPAAVEILGEDLSCCLTFFRFPPRHWKRLRTSNPLERQFLEVRRRTKVVGRFPTERSALALVFAVLEQEREKRRGLHLHDGEVDTAVAVILSLKERPIVVVGFEDVAA
jgi:transposase-like protein